MHKVRVRRRQLRGIGEAFEIDAVSGATVTVVAHRSRQRDLALGRAGDEPTATASLSVTEAVAVASLLTSVHIELTISAS